MSLVAYAASSDEDSESEEENPGPQVEQVKPQAKPSTIASHEAASVEPVSTSGHISDEDDDYVPQEVSLQELKTPTARLTMALPKPKVIAPAENTEEEDVDQLVTPAFAKLPMPRTAAPTKLIIEEKDDEFLHKKALPVEIEKPPPPPVKGRVKISIPSLREFSDVDREKADKAKNKVDKPNVPKGSGLLSLLPQAKSERNFSKSSSSSSSVAATPTASSSNAPQATSAPVQPRSAPAFVPDTVKQRRAAHNTEGVDCTKAVQKKNTEGKEASKPMQSKTKAKTTSLVNASDSEDDDEDGTGDFFSLNSEQKLPEVSSNEISALVAKRAAKMVEASSKYLEEIAEKEAAEAEAARLEEEQTQQAQKRYHEQQLNPEAMDALVGKNAKRRRKEAKEMQVIDIVGSQVLPDREEWMRTALASSTTFQPTGVLTDEEPVAGTRRKHQITYLAHKAKANEAELQAMWSANRQTRRATQSKYGF
ncbi:proline-rich protein PRCC [Drosophila elegans]|uniref:proline-rich protein PRCC n=1 Tax=Drosophila elegans TaxID=30023 RepID=UPI0007E5DEC4|nr:proline-rich protein PRCC [Drosophila elegans]